MSTDNSNSLETMVEKTLESTGVLSKMRAELRANVFHILEKGATFQEKIYSDTIKNFVSNNDGILLLSLVKELLEYLGLNFTASVFDPEIGAGKNFHYKNEDDLLEELSVAKDDKRPMLLQILEAYQTHSKSNTTDCKTKRNNEDDVAFGKTPFVQITKTKKAEPSKTTVAADNRNDSPTKSKISSPIKIGVFERDNIRVNKNAEQESLSLSSSYGNDGYGSSIKTDQKPTTKDCSAAGITSNVGSVDQPTNNTDEDNNSDVKSLRNESSLDEVETDENISVGNDSVQSTLTESSAQDGHVHVKKQ